MDGHALAVAALGAILADEPDDVAVEELRRSLGQTASTDARVAKVLSFYAGRLTAADRYLVAAVALFSRPVTIDAVLQVMRSAATGEGPVEWDVPAIRSAVRGRLSGLVSWHPDDTVVAHSVVRLTFRPLAFGAAHVAADITLAGVPDTIIENREQGQQVVEAIELLLDAGEWGAADSLYNRRTDAGQAWTTLPAPRLGQRAATAFVATPERRTDCAANLSPRDFSWYLNQVGLRALAAGDMATANEYLAAAVDEPRTDDDPLRLARRLLNLVRCLGQTGQVGGARTHATAALGHARQVSDDRVQTTCEFWLGWIAFLSGDTRAAETHYRAAAARGGLRNSPLGVRWAQFLAGTGRPDAARTLTESTFELAAVFGRNETIAHCQRVLATLDLADPATSDPTKTLSRIDAAVTTLRDGDALAEPADTLPVAADAASAIGDHDAAHQHVAEAFDIAGPRGLVPAQIAALTARARICLSAGAINASRDTAGTAHRIAVAHDLRWHELAALDIHTRLDHAEGTDHGWTEQARQLRAHLIPDGLDPDALARR